MLIFTHPLHTHTHTHSNCTCISEALPTVNFHYIPLHIEGNVLSVLCIFLSDLLLTNNMHMAGGYARGKSKSSV